MRTNKQSFGDKILGLFGIKRPKSSTSRNNSSSRANNASRTNSSKASSLMPSDSRYSNNTRNRDIQSRRTSQSSRTRKRADLDGGLLLDDNFEIIKQTSPKKRNAKKKKKGGVFLKVLLSAFLIMVITGSIIVGAFMIYLFNFVDGTIDQDLNNLKLAYTSVVYAKDGENKDGTPKYVELKRLHGTENRLWTDLKNLPDYVSKAYVSAEDKRFYQHVGVDWKRTFSVALNTLFKFYDTQQGGSTITQQLVKNITKDNEVSYDRKLREIMRAQYLESCYSKDVILECYLNTIHLGPGVDGIEVASCYYFDKTASELTLTQSAALAAITKEPEHYNPFKNPEDNRIRRNWVLDEMFNNGYITKEQCEEAKNADLGLREKPSTVLSSANSVEEEVNSYFVDALIEDVIKGLQQKKGYDYNYAESQLFAGGYKIYSTIDLDVQDTLEEVFTDDDNFMKVRTNSGKGAQAAMTVMDYKGHVVGVVGGRGEKKVDRGLNRATQSPRQTGSSIKPITCYAPAIEYNKITWGSKMEDEATMYVDGSKWPVNYSGYYSGTVSVLYALQQSLNTIPVTLVKEMGLETSLKFANDKMGITTLYKEKEVDGKTKTDLTYSSLALGGSLYGVTTTELTAAYCPFGNLGTYYQPHFYTKILDQFDNVVIDTSNDHHRAVSEETANITCEMLQTVTTSGTGSPAAFGGWPIMSKTGTTSDTKDRWFVGCTPYYAAAVWFGMDSSEAMGGLYSNPALKLWKAVMTEIMDGKEKIDFPESDSVVYIKYCSSSGKVARSGCKSTKYGYFKSSYMPVCDYHGGSQVSAADKSDSDSYDDEEEETKTTTKKNNQTTTATQSKVEATTVKKTEIQTEPKTQAVEEKPSATQAKTEANAQTLPLS